MQAKRRWVGLVLGVVVLLSFGSVVSSQGYRTFLPFVGRSTDLAPGPIKIAVLNPMTGPVRQLGEHQRDGVVLAFEEWNAAGKVLGREVEWTLGDTQCNATVALQAAQQAVEQDKVRYIIGALCSTASVSISDYVNQNAVLQIAPISSGWPVTVDGEGRVKPYTFRAGFEDSFDVRVMGAFARGRLSAQKAAVLASNDLQGMGQAFRDAFEGGGGQVVVYETFDQTQADFGTVLDTVKAANLDVMFVASMPSQTNLIAAQAIQKGITTVMLGWRQWEGEELDLTALEGDYYPQQYSSLDPRPEVTAFIGRFERRYGYEPDVVAVLAYDAANVLLEAIQDAGADNPAVVKDVMAAGEFDVVTGTISFDDYHNPINNAAIMKIQGGQVVFETSFRPDWAGTQVTRCVPSLTAGKAGPCIPACAVARGPWAMRRAHR